MNTDLDALAIRLYVTIDDLLIDHPDWAPERPTVGIEPKLTDAAGDGGSQRYLREVLVFDEALR